MNVDPQHDRIFHIISALLVEVMFDRLTAARALVDQLDAALSELEKAKVREES